MNTALIMNKFSFYQSVLTAYLQNGDLESKMSKKLLQYYMFGVFFAVASKDEDFFKFYKGHLNKTNNDDDDLQITSHVVGALRNIYITSDSLSPQGFVQSCENSAFAKFKIEYTDREILTIFVKFANSYDGNLKKHFSELENIFLVKGLRAGSFFNDDESYQDKFEEPYEFAIDLHKDLKSISKHIKTMSNSSL